MPRKVYQNGDLLFAEDINAIAYPVVDGEDIIGHGPKVLDTYLDDAPTQIKSKFYTFYDRLKVSHNTGLTFSYLGGALLLNNGNVVTISPSTISVANNTTSYIFVGSTGTVQSSTVLPNECFPLARVTTVSGTLSGGVTDLRDKIIDRIIPGTIPAQQLIPPGSGMEFWGSTLPSGWLWADGASYSTSTYPELFAAIGYTHGGSGGTFKVPDKRGRTSVGAGTGTGLTTRLLGQTFGEESVTLNTSQIPSHSHSVNDSGHNHSINDPGHGHNLFDPGHVHGVNDPGHGHNLPGQTFDLDASDGSDGDGSALRPLGNYAFNNTTGVSLQSSLTNVTLAANRTNVSLNAANSNISINSQGGGGSHNNLQPSLVCNYIIKF